MHCPIKGHPSLWNKLLLHTVCHVLSHLLASTPAVHSSQNPSLSGYSIQTLPVFKAKLQAEPPPGSLSCQPPGPFPPHPTSPFQAASTFWTSECFCSPGRLGVPPPHGRAACVAWEIDLREETSFTSSFFYALCLCVWMYVFMLAVPISVLSSESLGDYFGSFLLVPLGIASRSRAHLTP